MATGRGQRPKLSRLSTWFGAEPRGGARPIGRRGHSPAQPQPLTAPAALVLGLREGQWGAGPQGRGARPDPRARSPLVPALLSRDPSTTPPGSRGVPDLHQVLPSQGLQFCPCQRGFPGGQSQILGPRPASASAHSRGGPVLPSRLLWGMERGPALSEGTSVPLPGPQTAPSALPAELRVTARVAGPGRGPRCGCQEMA